MTTTLKAARRDLALKASSLKLVTTGVKYAGTYQGAASGSDAARQIISSDLGTANLAGTSSEIPPTARDYQWTWVPLLSEQRRIVKNGFSGYNAASDVLTGQNAGANAYTVGYVTVDRAHAVTLPPNVEAEILGRFPALSYEETPGLHWAINEALQVLHEPKKESVTGDGTQRINVASSFPYLRRPEQLIRVFDVDPSNGQGPPVMYGKSWLEPDGEKMWLHLPRAVESGSTFTIQVRIPASRWVLVKRTAVASVTVTAGAVTAVTVVDGGTGYIATPTVTISGAGSNATATATVTNGAVASIAVGAGGSGYVQGTTFATIAAPTTTTWAASTVGPVNDEDEVLPEVDRITAAAYWMLCLRMARRGPKPQQADWAAEAKLAGEAAAPFTTWQNEPPTPPQRRRIPYHPTGRSWRPLTAARRWP